MHIYSLLSLGPSGLVTENESLTSSAPMILRGVPAGQVSIFYSIPSAAEYIYLLAVSVSLSLSPLTSKSSLHLLWQHNPKVCHIWRPAWTTHMQSTLPLCMHAHAVTTLHRDVQSHHTHAQTNTFPQRGFAHSRTEVTSHHEPNEASVARRGREMEGWMERNNRAICRRLSGAINQRDNCCWESGSWSWNHISIFVCN